MRLSVWIAIRYLWGGRNHYAGLINWITFAGLSLGVLVLTVVVSVMNGFDAELRSRILSTVPHLLLTGASESELAQFAATPGVTGAHRFFATSGMIASAGTVATVTVYGLDQDGAAAMAHLNEQMQGSGLAEALQGQDGLVLGLPLARALGVALGEDVLLTIPEAASGSIRPRFKRYRLSGLFQLGADFDYSLALVSRQSFSALERRQLGVDSVWMALADPLMADSFAAAWRRRGSKAQIEAWTQTYGELFQAVRIEKALMFLTLLLVVAVAGFNIISGQAMVVNGKRTDIAVLQTLGATGALIKRVFLLQGMAVASLGVAVGLILGLLTALNVGPAFAQIESWLGFSLLEGSYFEAVPARVKALDLAFVGGASWLLCLMAAWVPARWAAAQNPVEGLHLS